MKRRKFIENMALFSGSLAINLSGISLQAIANPLQKKQADSEGKIIVFIQLFGGNDGLNTLVPFDDDLYHINRPTLAVPKNKVIKISHSMGFHPSMEKMGNLFKDGQMSIIQNVGYQQPDRSHFRSTDIWNSASASDEYLYDGWAARYLSTTKNMDPENQMYPLAVELGWSGSLLLEDHKHTHGVFMRTLEEYESFLQSGTDVFPNPPGLNLQEQELRFINNIALQSNKFSQKIKEASTKGRNHVNYPDTFLGRQLAIVAKLIGGGLETSVYVAKLGGFDTHVNQSDTHAPLLLQVSEAIYAFQKDIEKLGVSEKVSTLIYSEFGRRLQEGGFGTDHGTAAPIFVIGSPVRGGIIGNDPNLSELDANGDLVFKYDFKQIYSTILTDHLSLAAMQISGVLHSEHSTLPIYHNSIEPFPNEIFRIDSVFPNPFTEYIKVKFTLFERCFVEIAVFDEKGNKLFILMQEYKQSGTYTSELSTTFVSPGRYLCALKINQQYKSKLILKVH